MLTADGWRVRALSRRDPAAALWSDCAPEVIPGDLDHGEALARLCAGADVLIHGAGLTKARSRAAFDAVNVEGARRVARAAQSAGVPHVVLVSSLTAREPRLSHYSASKAGGEAAMAETLGERLTVTRPCAIYGPGDRELLPVFKAAASSPVLPLFDERARVAMIHVEDAARQIAAIAAGAPRPEVIALCDDRPEGYSWRELMTEAARACGRNPRLVRVPGALVQAIGITNDFTRLLGAAPMLTTAKTRELLHPDWAISAKERPHDALPALYSLSRGFYATVEWYRNAAWMKH